MARISNTSAYPNIVAPTTNDYVVLTDQSDNLVTKSCTLGELQNLFGLDTLVAHVQVNSAEQLLLSTTPKELIAAPGANKVIDVIDAAIYVDAGTSAYNYANNLVVKNGNSYDLFSITAQTANFSTDIVKKFQIATGVLPQNTAVTLNTAANPTQGNGVLYLNLFYRVLNVGITF